MKGLKRPAMKRIPKLGKNKDGPTVGQDTTSPKVNFDY